MIFLPHFMWAENKKLFQSVVQMLATDSDLNSPSKSYSFLSVIFQFFHGSFEAPWGLINMRPFSTLNFFGIFTSVKIFAANI